MLIANRAGYHTALYPGSEASAGGLYVHLLGISKTSSECIFLLVYESGKINSCFQSTIPLVFS
jgi:hypothetical protein